MRIIKYKELDNSFYKNNGPEEIKSVKEIIAEVKKEKDDALKKYTEKFDGIKLNRIEITSEEVKDAYEQVDKEIITALKEAGKNITKFAKAQFRQIKDFELKNKDFILGQKIIPIERVGCYIPGGRYPLPSTALMCIIPAKVAGVKEVIACSPKISAVTIVACDLASADRIFRVGGVQAIAAMAYGTETIPKVDKIVGPGNKYVAYAKKLVYGDVGIDFIAGPSEVMVIADETGDAEFIAADLLAQAEHDTNAKAILVTTSEKIAQKVIKSVERQIKTLKTKEVAEEPIKNGLIIIVESIDKAAEVANNKAPEHLCLQVKNPKLLVKKLRNFGSLFIGKYSAESFGDYASGTNHTLPTNGAARYASGLSVNDFVKRTTYQIISANGARKLSKTASKLADAEGLEAHKKAAEIRENLKKERWENN